jgi:hypothetical protein
MVPAALMPLAATSQIIKPPKATTEGGEAVYKYQAYAGYAYTSLNQVNGSRYGLQGASLSVTRNFGKYFGLTAEGDAYEVPLGSPVVQTQGNTVTPSEEAVFFGPEIHAEIYGRYSGFVHGLLGGEHIGGYGQSPNISFAGGAGGGMEYTVTPRFAVRASGDDILSSFTVINPYPGDSPHRTRSSRASIGIVYRF